MPNNYYERLSEMNPGELADGLAIEQEFDAIGRGFAKLPNPHRDGRGFEGPTRVGDPVEETDAVNFGTLEKLNLPIYRKKITTEDWNTITDAGIYDVVNATGANKAPGYNYGVLTVYKFNGVVKQDYNPDQNQQGVLLKRVCSDISSNQWGTWDGALPTSQVSAYGKTLIDDQDAASARVTLGLGSAATKSTSGINSGAELMEQHFRDFRGIVGYDDPMNFPKGVSSGIQDSSKVGASGSYVAMVSSINYFDLSGYAAMAQWFANDFSNGIGVRVARYLGPSQYDIYFKSVYFRTTNNTVVDANGFIKSASPIMRLHGGDGDDIAYLYRDESWFRAGCSIVNMEAVGAIATKLSTGHYVISGCHGFSREGWYIETPNDANGNKLMFVRYQQHDDGVIEIWTSSPDYSSGRCLEGDPVDIPAGRWIDLRLCMDDRDIGPNFS